MGSRLEYLLIPLVFGLGGPLVAMVGTNMGAGQRERALHAAWIGAAIAAGLCQTIGLCAALTPGGWLALFDRDPANIEARSRYLQTVGPFYGQFGLGMALYFASQGAGRLLWPLIANVGRLVVASGGGWPVLQLGGTITHLERAGWKLRDVERIEIKEAFGRSRWPRNLACPRTSLMSMAAPSPHGHPIGATGAVLTTRLLHAMRRDRLRRGIVTLCIGGGQGIALALEPI
jgi:hypothetical protein